MISSNSVGRCQQAFTSRQVPVTSLRCRQSRLCVRAEDRKGGIDFQPGRQGKETGYLKEDSAGQENIFAVESKAFVGNKGGLGAGNAAFAGVAAGIAVAAIAVGVFLSKSSGSPQDVIPAKIQEEIPTQSLSSISKALKEKAKETAEAAADAAPSIN